MTPAEFKAARDALGMSTTELAEWLGLDGAHGRTMIREMESGKRSISGPIRRALMLATERGFDAGRDAGFREGVRAAMSAEKEPSEPCQEISRASDLVSELQRQIARHGDLPISVTYESVESDALSVYRGRVSKSGEWRLLLDADGDFYRKDFEHPDDR